LILKKNKNTFNQLKLILSLFCDYIVRRRKQNYPLIRLRWDLAILLQRDNEDRMFHPIYYASGKTTPIKAKYDSYKLEVLVIVKALKKFRVYLIGIPFIIVIDCKAFTQTMKKKDVCAQVTRWAFFLEDLRYTTIHRPGNSVWHVNALSRHWLREIDHQTVWKVSV